MRQPEPPCQGLQISGQRWRGGHPERRRAGAGRRGHGVACCPSAAHPVVPWASEPASLTATCGVGVTRSAEAGCGMRLGRCAEWIEVPLDKRGTDRAASVDDHSQSLRIVWSP